MNFAIFLRALFFTEHLWLLLRTVIIIKKLITVCNKIRPRLIFDFTLFYHKKNSHFQKENRFNIPKNPSKHMLSLLW